MKEGIHPKYAEIQVTCSCGNQFATRSTTATKPLHVEVCSPAIRSTRASRR